MAAGFLAAGVSPGAVLVFMLAGPATNIGTLGIIRRELGLQSLIAYLFGVIATALMFGWLTNGILVNFALMDSVTGAHQMNHSQDGLAIGFGLLLLALMVKAKFKR
jgi:hypothetical protein